MTEHPHGIHHVSSLTGDIVRNHDFYTRVLGLRLVKKTVNQDDPGMYHLFYSDRVGSPGMDSTFFDYPGASRVKRGNNSISRLSYRVADEQAMAYWTDRLRSFAVVVHEEVRDGFQTLVFDDPDGTPLSIFASPPPRVSQPWDRSPVPPEHQLISLGYIVITVPDLRDTNLFLTKALNLEQKRSYTDPEVPFPVYVYETAAGDRGEGVHVLVRDDLPAARYGAGSVHHVALRVPDRERLTAWAAHLSRLGYPNSGEVERHWFRSVYVREPNGVLFELATDGPGFDTDEDVVSLGEKLALPPHLESKRTEIEARLHPLV